MDLVLNLLFQDSNQLFKDVHEVLLSYEPHGPLDQIE